MRLDPRTDLADSPFRREQRILGLIAKYEALGMRGPEAERWPVVTASKGTAVPKQPPPAKPRRTRMTWEQERERRKQRRSALRLARFAAEPKPNPAAIVAECCAEVGVDPAIVLSDARIPWMCLARWRVWKAMRDRGMRVTAIGAAVGRDHSSISHGLRLLRQHDERAANKPPAQVCQRDLQGV